jgi:ABC-type tungstate transport system permease subunit
VVGPGADPAHVAGGHDAVAAFTAIAGAAFVARGDKSGTDALEHRLDGPAAGAGWTTSSSSARARLMAFSPSA